MQYYNIIKTANAAIESLDLYAENITNDDDMKPINNIEAK